MRTYNDCVRYVVIQMIQIKLNSLSIMGDILHICRKYESKVQSIDAICGSYSVDACSTLGLLALMGNTITIKIISTEQQYINKIIQELENIKHVYQT